MRYSLLAAAVMICWLSAMAGGADAPAAPDAAPAGAPGATVAPGTKLPPTEAAARQRIESSPRHAEYADIKVPDGRAPLRCYVVYPQVKEKAPVVIVIHEIFGLTDWVKSVADQLAAEGFIAIAPDLLSGQGRDGGGTDAFGGRDEVMKAIRTLKPENVNAALDAVREYGLKLPSSNGKTAAIGFCWGGGTSFQYAVHQPALAAAVVYYGTNPREPAQIEKIKAPVLGLYGGNDNRVNATVGPAADAMKKENKTYVTHTYDGAGHGFLRQQDGQDGANHKAAQQAWPVTIKFLTEHTRAEK